MQRFWNYSRVLASGAPAPGANITVYIAGTLTPASIFADTLDPPTPKANPFTADLTDGYLFFYAANGRYDVQLDGVDHGIPTPYVWGDILLSDTGASAVGVIDVSLGGSRTVGLDVTTDPQTLDVIDFPAGGVLVPAIGDLPVGTTMAVVVECQVGTGESVVAALVDGLGNTLGTDPAPFTDATQFVTHEFDVAPPATQRAVYLRLTITGGVGAPPAFAIGKISFLPTI